MGRTHDPGAVDCDVHVDPVEVDVLLSVRIDQIMVVMTRDREHRLAVHLRVVKAVEEMNSSRPRGGQANAKFASVLCVGAGHKSGRFLMPDLDKSNLVLLGPE